MRFNVRLIPNSKEFAVRKTDKGYSIKITQKPEKGKANLALEKALSDKLGLKVSLISGFTSRNKTIEIEGTKTEILHRLDGLCKNEKS